MTTNNPLRNALTPLLDALVPVGHYPGEPARLAGRIPADHLAYLPDTESTRLALAVMVDAHKASMLADTAPPADELVRDLRRLLEDCTPVLATIGAVDTVRDAVRRLQTEPARPFAMDTDWSEPVIATAEMPPIDLTGAVGTFPPKVRLAVGGESRDYVMEAEAPDAIDQIIDAMTPAHLARRPGDLLQEACIFAMGHIAATPDMWAKAAEQFGLLMGKGAHPEPTDLPMDGSRADASQLLESAVRGLEEFGHDRPLASGGYRQDRLDRMAGAIRLATWLRACMANDPGEAGAALRDRLRLHDPDGGVGYGESVFVHMGPVHGMADVRVDLRGDNGELPVPPMAGDWTMSAWDPDNRPYEHPQGLEPTDWVVVAASMDGPGELTQAGDVFWGPLVVGMSIRAWRRASEQEVATGKVLPNLQADRVTRFTLRSEGGGVSSVMTEGGTQSRFGNPTWADFDRLQAQLTSVDTHVSRLIGVVDRVLAVVEDGQPDMPARLRGLADQMERMG